MAKVQLFDYQRPTIGMSNIGTDNTLTNLALVQDTYSGKYYGEQSFDEITKSIESAKQYFSSVIQESEKPNPLKITTAANTDGYSMGDLAIPSVNPVEYAKTTLESLGKFSLAPENYVQKPMMLKSYDKYGDNWNRYFEGNYKNPRLAESQKEAAMQRKNPTVSNLSIGDSNNKSVRTTGTGIASSGSINPFGSLDSGLNI